MAALRQNFYIDPRDCFIKPETDWFSAHFYFQQVSGQRRAATLEIRKSDGIFECGDPGSQNVPRLAVIGPWTRKRESRFSK